MCHHDATNQTSAAPDTPDKVRLFNTLGDRLSQVGHSLDGFSLAPIQERSTPAFVTSRPSPALLTTPLGESINERLFFPEELDREAFSEGKAEK